MDGELVSRILAFSKALASMATLLPLVTREEDRADKPKDEALQPHVLLTLESRRRLLEVIEAEPGVPLVALPGKLGVSWFDVRYNFALLEQAGLVEKRTSGRFTLVFPGGRAPPEGDPSLMPPATKEVARFILAHPGKSSAEIAVKFGVTQRYIQKHVDVLQDAKLVKMVASGRNRTYHPTQKLADVVAAWPNPK